MSTKNIGKYFPITISKKQATDTGMAMLLILLLIGYFSENNLYFKISIPVLIVNMTIPMFFYPFAIAWLGFSQLLGTIVSKILLTVVYVTMVIPVGLVRRIFGKDTLQLSEFKKDTGSVMKTRNYIFTSKDIERPF